MHIFNSWSSVYPISYQQHDIGCTDNPLLKMCKTEGSSDLFLISNIVFVVYCIKIMNNKHEPA